MNKNLLELLKNIKFDENGLIPVIVQDYKTGRVLMLAYMNEFALKKTLETKEAWYWSRSRKELWHKGETSGNIQRVLDIKIDCDGDAILLIVEQKGSACHTGNYSCFYRSVNNLPENFLFYLEELIKERKETLPENSYTTKLFKEGLEKIMQKVGEESIEVIISGMKDDKESLTYEISDLMYHLLVALISRDLSFRDIIEEMVRRHKRSMELKSL
ncbi:MAG: bifunctional phosphoribosyl-AMP cyclohydrolase/phosphoribosyl-ATP diphosphatase HisIE [Dictyoglomus sp.]|nr:bifunctional phosphoribosyl-AMP cyclohydrolase/phosphoribosyl-ATP diphosphatase HisIE [Dictyoglomus sp.]MCX7941923.1 bifunctional phosphoribosyl-AMP cyclohydrolase/phosphoribosyl-ATP diphosphatase HisIE [Dictyoglomaceae bacterium]MDW8188614.1 bifunctional phosphoribosyl-AMP cyclohydrolase/phosphoribosyl-ATP diphosphatase HisIE [Dictyoglomus sp.]